MRNRFLLVVALTITMLAVAGGDGLAGKGNGNGGGKPGGEDPPEPTPEGTLYIHVKGDGYYSMDGDGGQQTYLFGDSLDPNGSQPDGTAAPSYLLHGGERWILIKRWVDELLADNNWRRELLAVSDQGDHVVLWSQPGARVYRQSWAKDDSFLSFLVAYPASGLCQVIRMDVDWSTGAPEVDAASAETVLVGTFSRNLPSFGRHDWSPDGSKLVYTERDLGASPLAFSVRVLDYSSGSSVYLHAGSHPAWSPVDARIAFWRDAVHLDEEIGGISTIKADGTGLQEITADGKEPAWSPDGDHLAFQQLVTSGKGKRKVTRLAVFRVSTAGGNATLLTGGISVDATPLGWR